MELDRILADAQFRCDAWVACSDAKVLEHCQFPGCQGSVKATSPGSALPDSGGPMNSTSMPLKRVSCRGRPAAQGGRPQGRQEFLQVQECNSVGSEVTRMRSAEEARDLTGRLAASSASPNHGGSGRSLINPFRGFGGRSADSAAIPQPATSTYPKW